MLLASFFLTMWLLPALARISTLAMRTYYRFQVRGGPVPSSGPVLLVANHPNSILDPGGVAAAAGRPVRFLAKAPFFSQPVVGTLMRAVGAIPVYRRMDDPSQVDKNEEMFRAVHGALAGGSAVGLFPEGLTHSRPALAPLRTGAARIALGAAQAIGHSFPVIAIGLFFQHKDIFRSRALAMVGEPIQWDDLAGLAESDADAVRELTRRLEDGLQSVTVNLENWEDAPAVEAAASIYSAEFGAKRGPDVHLRRLQNMTDGLRELRERDPDRLQRLLSDVLRFRDTLSRLRVEPGDLSITPRFGLAARWFAQRIIVFALAAPIAAIGRIILFPPFAGTRLLAQRWPAGAETISTIKILGGAVLYLLWFFLLAVLTAFYFGVLAGVGVFIGLFCLGFLTMYSYESLREGVEDARTFLILRSRGTLRERLVKRRGQLAAKLEEIRNELRIQRSDGEARIG